MTQLIPQDYLEVEQIFDSMTEWLDDVFTTAHRHHRLLSKIVDYVDVFNDELMDLDRSVRGELTPSATVAAHRLGMRCRDLHTVIENAWQSTSIRRTSLRALQGIHEHYLGPIQAERGHTVLFEISRLVNNRDLDAYVESWRIERTTNWGQVGQRRYLTTLAVVEGPLWVHDVYRHLGGESPQGHALRERYMRGGTTQDRNGETPSWDFVGGAIAKPDKDIVQAALVLWDPFTDDSPYMRFAAATAAAELL